MPEPLQPRGGPRPLEEIFDEIDAATEAASRRRRRTAIGLANVAATLVAALLLAVGALLAWWDLAYCDGAPPSGTSVLHTRLAVALGAVAASAVPGAVAVVARRSNRPASTWTVTAVTVGVTGIVAAVLIRPEPACLLR